MIGILNPWLLAGFLLYSATLSLYWDWNGAARVQKSWDLHTIQEQLDANKARDDAAHDFPPLPEEAIERDRAIVPRGQPCRVYDPKDRDCSGVRRIR